MWTNLKRFEGLCAAHAQGSVLGRWGGPQSGRRLGCFRCRLVQQLQLQTLSTTCATQINVATFCRAMCLLRLYSGPSLQPAFL